MVIFWLGVEKGGVSRYGGGDLVDRPQPNGFPTGQYIFFVQTVLSSFGIIFQEASFIH